MQPNDPNYKPKTTIIPANPGASTPEGHAVVAWVIEDGQVVRAVTTPCQHSGGLVLVSSALLARGAGE